MSEVVELKIPISIVTATRNRTDLLERALRSVAKQTWTDLEAIVVDDGSSSEVLAHHEQLLRQLGKRFRLIKAPCPGARGTGPSAARNRGAMAARGKFIAFIDDDDEWPAENYLELAVTALTGHDADYFFGHLEGERDGHPQEPGWVPPREWLVREKLVGTAPDVYQLSQRAVLTIARRFMIHPSNSVIRRDTFLKSGGFFEQLWSHAEDLNLMLRVMDVARRVLYAPTTVTRYRLPTGNSISLTELEQMHFLQRILAAQHARIHCQNAELRSCARAREAWTYREMARRALASGHGIEARAFARQAFATYPTFGSSAFVLRTGLASLVSHFRSSSNSDSRGGGPS